MLAFCLSPDRATCAANIDGCPTQTVIDLYKELIKQYGLDIVLRKLVVSSTKIFYVLQSLFIQINALSNSTTTAASAVMATAASTSGPVVTSQALVARDDPSDL